MFSKELGIELVLIITATLIISFRSYKIIVIL